MWEVCGRSSYRQNYNLGVKFNMEYVKKDVTRSNKYRMPTL